MLSAVENHFGPSRLYATGAHPYNNSSAAAAAAAAAAAVIGANSNLIAAPCPIVALPPPMSATEFARPHPKTNRYASLRFTSFSLFKVFHSCIMEKLVTNFQCDDMFSY